MPVKKTQLNRQEQARYLVRVQELQAAGLDCELPNELPETSNDLDIRVAPHSGNLLCQLSTGVTWYAIQAQLVSLRSNLILENFDIASGWDSELIAACANAKRLYGDRAAFDFTEKETLNHKIENGLHFHDRGDVAEGWLVASGHKLIPEKFRDRMITKLSITFTDQFGYEYSAQAEASLLRSAHLKRSGSRLRKSPGLFEIGGPKTAIWSPEVPASTLSGQAEGRGGAESQRRRQDDDGRSVPRS